MKSIDFLKTLKAVQKNVRLKLYKDPPFLKMTILGDYIWLQHYQPGLDVQKTPKHVFKHDPNIGSLYFPFYQYFMGRWNSPEIPEYDLETDQLIYRDGTGNEVKTEKFYETKPYVATNGDLTHRVAFQNETRRETKTLPPLWTHKDCTRPENSCGPLRQNLCSGLHPGSKEFFLLRSKSLMAESAGWIAI
jgi:hypothetical protein